MIGTEESNTGFMRMNSASMICHKNKTIIFKRFLKNALCCVILKVNTLV